jgi:hypothetical protein
MKAIETRAEVHNGMLHIPLNQPELENREVKVVVMWEETETRKNKKEEFLKAVDAIATKGVFKDITDPVAWQRKMREEEW